MKKLGRVIGGLAWAVAAAGPVNAQVLQTLIEAPVPLDYSRGRNVSVIERDRPELRAIGYQVGAFTAFPAVDLGMGYNNNVYTTRVYKKDDLYYTVNPSLIVRSDWRRHALSFRANGDLVRYADQTLRNQSGYNAAASARLDVGEQSSVNLDGGTGRLFESRFSGATPNGVASSIPYQRTFASVRGTYVGGSTRLIGVADIYKYDFKSIRLLNDQKINQDFRDRTVKRVTGQFEYGLTAITGLFAQVSYTDTDYRLKSFGLGNRSSEQIRGLVGATTDLTSLLRGSLGVGYVRRNYDAAVYKSAGGFSFEGQLEYFPSPITTLTLTGRRTIEDATFGLSSGYINTGGSFRIDHELSRFLLLHATADYEHDTYRGVKSSTDILRSTAGARYSFSREIALSGLVSYGKRHFDGLPNGPYFSETRGLLTLSIQR